MSDVAVTWAKAQDCPTKASKPVLAFLASWADATGEAWAAIPILALELQIDPRSVQRSLSELRKAEPALLIPTGKWRVWEGKRYPIWQLPLDQGYPSTTAKLKAIRVASRELAQAAVGEGVDNGLPRTLVSGEAGGVPRTLVSPQGSSPDSSVTPSPDSSVTQIGKGKGKECSNEHSGEREAFDACLAAYEDRGQARTHVGHAREAFRPIFRELGAAAALAAVRRYVAEDADLKRGDYGAPAFETWCESERWRRYLPRAAASAVAPRTGFVGPAEVLDAIVVALPAGASRALTLLEGATWREADRTVIARAWAVDELRRDVPWKLQQSLSIRFEGASPRPVSA